MAKQGPALLFALFALIALRAAVYAKDAMPAEAGRDYFYSSVLPKLAQNGCPACHAVGYVHPNVTIYQELVRRLAIGDSPTNNAVIYKIAAVRSIAPDRPEHPGGRRCVSIDAEPCASIQRWWTIEFGNTSDNHAVGSGHE